MLKEIPPGFEHYKPFSYESDEAVVCVRPEDVKGWQAYADHNDTSGTWTVLITLKEGYMRVKLPEPNARDLVRKLSSFITADVARVVNNGLLFRKKAD